MTGRLPQAWIPSQWSRKGVAWQGLGENTKFRLNRFNCSIGSRRTTDDTKERLLVHKLGNTPPLLLVNRRSKKCNKEMGSFSPLAPEGAVPSGHDERRKRAGCGTLLLPSHFPPSSPNSYPAKQLSKRLW